MKRLAVFVEGQTEEIFVSKLLTEIANAGQIAITKVVAEGGNKFPRTLRVIEAARVNPDQQFYILIVNCGSDSSVKSDVRDQYDSLVNAGYEMIIGIRDVYPILRADIAALRAGLAYGIKQAPVVPLFLLGVMEVESWFLAEHTHFPRLHANLTAEAIRNALGFDPSVDDMLLRDNPALDLHNAYHLVGFAYTKKRKNVQRTVDLLDYAKLYLETSAQFEDLGQLTTSIEQFLN